jgi:hypothetical protein
MQSTSREISERLVRTICQRLADDRQVRRTLPVWGRVHVDRQLPFLCVYRRPSTDPRRDAGFRRLVTSEASYLTACGTPSVHPGLERLVRGISGTLAREFGGFLLLELWATRSAAPSPDPLEAHRPRFCIVASKA